MVYMLTFGVYGWYMLPYIAYMDPMGIKSPWLVVKSHGK